MEFTLENFNPDAMDVSHVRAWAAYLRQIETPARALFGARGFIAGQALVIQLWLYCEMKARAMEARLSGNIPLAAALEMDCDEIYQRLPADVRW